MTSEATLELLLDLKHDLGKYLSLPFALLPKTADDAALRVALSRALQQTRTKRAADGGGYQSAREIWLGFAAELAQSGLAPAAVVPLAAAVERALGWEEAIAGDFALDRAAIERDFGAVQAAIARLIDEVRGG